MDLTNKKDNKHKMKKIKQFTLSSLAISTTLLITSCGGGGDNKSPNTPASSPPSNTYKIALDSNFLSDYNQSTNIRTQETTNQLNTNLTLDFSKRQKNLSQRAPKLEEKNITYSFSGHNEDLKLSYPDGSDHHSILFSPQKSEDSFNQNITITAILDGKKIATKKLNLIHKKENTILPEKDPKLTYSEQDVKNGKYIAFNVELSGVGLSGDGQEYQYLTDTDNMNHISADQIEKKQG